MALAGLIAGALRGDARSLMALETTGTDTAVLQEAMGLLAQRAEQPAVGQFAATIILRHARTGDGVDLGTLCTKCLQVTLAAPTLAGHRQLLSAAAAAAARAGPDAALQVHAEAMRLARLSQLEAGAGDGGTSALAALQLVHALAEESGKPVVAQAVRDALVAQGPEVFGLINAVLGGSAGERGISDGLECLKEWAETLGVGMDAVLATDGLLWSLCQMTQAEDEYVLDALADCLEGLLTRPFAGHSAAVRKAAQAAVRPEDQPWRNNAPALEQLGAAVASQRARLSDDQPMLVRRGLCRMAVAVAEVLPWVTAAAAQANGPLLECLVAGAQCRDRPTAAICIEGIVPLVYDLRFTECRDLSGMLSQALLGPILLHAEYINEDAEFEDEDVMDVYLDEEEWLRVREQTLADAVEAVYESQRAGLLQHAATSFQQAVTAGNWRGAEASLFVLGVAAPALMRRQLVRNPERFLATPASKAEGLTAEALAAEQGLGRDLLTQLFTLIGAGTSSPIAGMLEQPALAAAAARLAAAYARWLKEEAPDELLVGVFSTVVGILKAAAVDPAACSGGAAATERVKQACTALRNISSRATARLAPAVDAQPALAAELVAVCVELPDAVSNGGAWNGECAVDAVRGVCLLLAAAPSALAGPSAPARALAQCWSGALGTALSMASGAENVVDLASAEDGAAVILQYAAGLHGLSSTPGGTDCARAMLLEVSALLQAAASAWVDDDVAAAVAELLYRAQELAPSVEDELFPWMGSVITSLHAHHPGVACGVVEQLAARWGVDGAAAGAGCAAGAALQSLVGLLHASVSAANGAGGGPATEASVAALAATEQCLCMCASLIDPAYYPSMLAGAASACGAAEVSSLSGGLRFLGGLQQYAGEVEGALSPAHPLGQALGAGASPLGQALAHQLNGHCDDALVGMVAKTLHWLLSSEYGSVLYALWVSLTLQLLPRCALRLTLLVVAGTVRRLALRQPVSSGRSRCLPVAPWTTFRPGRKISGSGRSKRIRA